MADTTTTNLGLTKPEIGAAEDTWGISLNNDLDAIDAIFSATGTAVSLNIDGGDIASAVTINKSPVITLGGDLSGNVTLTNLASGTLSASLASSISPTFQNLTLSGTDSIKVPAGTTAQRNGSPVNGMLRYNSTTNQFEGYQNSAWGALGGGGGSSTTINNNADNRVITGSGTANTLEAEANLTYDGSTLSIVGDVNVTGTTPTITIGDGGAENTALVFDGNTHDFYLGLYDTSDSIVIGKGNSVGTNRNFEINSSGNVGIGHTPNSWVSGDTILQGKAGTSAWNLWGRNNTVRLGINHYFNGTNYVYTQDGGAASYEQAANSTNGMHTWHAADQGTAGNSFTNTEKMRLLDGNLMLGTQTPNIAGLSSATNTILAIKNSGGSTETADLRLDGPGGGIINFGDDNVRTGLLFSDNANFFEMATRVDKPLRFSVNSAEVMRLTSTGLGIGTTSPQSQLHIGGTTPTLTIGDGDAEDSKILFDGNAQDYYVGLDDTHDALIIGDGSTVGTNPLLTLRNTDIATFGSTNPDPMALTMAGYKLIIDTTGVNASLQMNGNLGARIDMGIAGSRKSVIYSDANNFLEFSRNTNHPIAFKTNSTERMRINSAGKVLLGTSTASSSTHARLVLGGGTENYIQFSSTNNVGGAIGVTSAGNIPFYTHTGAVGSESYSERMRITSSGNVGIGTTSPAVKLGVSGAIIASDNITAYGTPSDIRLKENIKVIDNALDKVKQLKGITYDLKSDGNRLTGLIAQDLQKVLPEAVYETSAVDDANDKHLAIRYGNTVGLLVEAIKEQQQIIEDLKLKIEVKNGN